MGTNYYAVGREACGECKRPYDDKEIHIGKSSAGWKFSFAWNDGHYYKNIEQFKKWLGGKKILDEYDREISHDDFWEMVEAKKNGLDSDSYYEQYPEHRSPWGKIEGQEIDVEGVRFIRGEFS